MSCSGPPLPFGCFFLGRHNPLAFFLLSLLSLLLLGPHSIAQINNEVIGDQSELSGTEFDSVASPTAALFDSSEEDEYEESWPNSTLVRPKRQIYRGQNYHYQRGYEMSRLRYEKRLQSDPSVGQAKPFFVREFHHGRDVPRPLLRLVGVSEGVTSSAGGRSITPGFAEKPVTGSAGGSGSLGSVRGGDSMKSLPDDYRQRLYATKAAIKAAIEAGDRDLSIRELLKARERARQPTQGAGNDGSPFEQFKEGQRGGGRGDNLNQNVLFDEQIKEDLNKIGVYDPSKAFGERLRPSRPSLGITGRPISSGYPNAGGARPGGGSGSDAYGPKTPTDSYLDKIRRLYPQLFPGFDTRGGGDGGGDGSGRQTRPSTTGGGGAGQPGGTGGVGGPAGSSGGTGQGGLGDGGDAGGQGQGGLSGATPGGPARPGSGSGTGGLIPGVSYPAVGTVGGIRTGPQYPALYPNINASYPSGPTTGIPGSAYPSRFPGSRLSALTLYPNVRNSTYPGIPGYIRYDFPGYSEVPYTGFRCDLQSYKYGYFADVAAGCQVFHICQKDGRMDSFLCPNGTLFHQKVMTCDWWYHVHCASSPSYYYLNGRIGVLPWLPATLARFD